MVSFSDNYQKILHARSFNNRGALTDSTKCGCFYCLRVFSPSEIGEWVNEETAVCPYCGVDTIMPESEDYELDDSLLLAMKEYWL